MSWASFHYELDGVEHLDDMGQSVSAEELCAAMAAGEDTTTSQVDVEQYVDHFERFTRLRPAHGLSRGPARQRNDVRRPLRVVLCTDICVISNALLIHATLPEVDATVNPALCAGVTPASHQVALSTMQIRQIGIAG